MASPNLCNIADSEKITLWAGNFNWIANLTKHSLVRFNHSTRSSSIHIYQKPGKAAANYLSIGVLGVLESSFIRFDLGPV